MGGQVLGGGVIVLVAVLLWLVYLLPSWHSRRQFDAAERNAVRLNQALRVLAETSETPEEVRLELNARTALAQQRLARRALAEREHTALEQSRIDLEQARAERAAARATPAARRTRARAPRRRTRLALTVARASPRSPPRCGARGRSSRPGRSCAVVGVSRRRGAAGCCCSACRASARARSSHRSRRMPRRTPRRRCRMSPLAADAARLGAARAAATAHGLGRIACRCRARRRRRARGAAAGRARRGSCVSAPRSSARRRSPRRALRASSRGSHRQFAGGGVDDAEIEAHVRAAPREPRRLTGGIRGRALIADAVSGAHL